MVVKIIMNRVYLKKGIRRKNDNDRMGKKRD